MSLYTDLLAKQIPLNSAQKINSDYDLMLAYDRAREDNVPIEKILNVFISEGWDAKRSKAILSEMRTRIKQKQAMIAKIKAEAEGPIAGYDLDEN